MPNFTPEQLDEAVKKKGQEIFDMFYETVNSQITDAVTQLAPNLAKEIAKACALTHVKPFKSPLETIPKSKLDGLNGSALEKLNMIVEFWKGVDAYLVSL